MANDVKNKLKVLPSPKFIEPVTIALKTMSQASVKFPVAEVLWGRGVELPEEFDHRTKFSHDSWEELIFISAWGPCYPVQEEICRILSRIDPNVIVEMGYIEEFCQFVGARQATMDQGKVFAYTQDYNIAEKLDKFDEKLDQKYPEKDFEDEEEAEAEAAEREYEKGIERDDFINDFVDRAASRTMDRLLKKFPRRNKNEYVNTGSD